MPTVLPYERERGKRNGWATMIKERNEREGRKETAMNRS